MSTKRLAPSKPLSQLGTPTLPLPHIEEGLNAQDCLSFRWLSLLWATACFHRTARACVFGLVAPQSTWVKTGCDLKFKFRWCWGWREVADAHANTEHEKIDLISFENKGNTAKVEFLHTVHSRHISRILILG